MIKSCFFPVLNTTAWSVGPLNSGICRVCHWMTAKRGATGDFSGEMAKTETEKTAEGKSHFGKGAIGDAIVKRSF
jgi:hypothetical protein